MENWARNITFGADRIHRPRTVDELRSVLSTADTARIVGAAHSFNDLVDTNADLVSLGELNRIESIDTEARTVTVEGGIRYHELCTYLNERGWALHNLPSIPHFSIAGACATGTHGSGDANSELAAAVSALELITAEGDTVALGRGDADFEAAVVSLGALGAVSRMTLDIEPAYRMAQELHLDTPLDAGIDAIDETMASAYSVSWFLDWRRPVISQIWRKHRLPDPGDDGTDVLPDTPNEILGGTRTDTQLGPRGTEGADYFTDQALRPGAWLDVLPHLKISASATPGTELQSEYFVARADGRAALEAVAAIGEVMSPVMRVSEIRSVASGDQWLSPFDEDRLALHFSWVNDWPALRQVLPVVERTLRPFEPRPHWGKLYELDPATVRGWYPRFDEFRAVAERLDPAGTFRNPHLDRLFG